MTVITLQVRQTKQQKDLSWKTVYEICKESPLG